MRSGGNAMTWKLADRRTRRALALAFALSLSGVACVTPAEFRKVQNRVTDLERAGGKNAEGQRIADFGTQIDALQHQLQELQGKVEVAQHRADQALDEARAARTEASKPGGSASATTPEVGAAANASDSSQEMQDYRAAYAEWRAENAAGCIDRFTKFLQTYPSSEHADDATYWLADCYFKQGNFSAAVLRFDDVARQYPKGNKAADALYRQGEALLRMGHAKAAGNAFEKVLRDYPDSARAPEAKKQLALLGAG